MVAAIRLGLAAIALMTLSACGDALPKADLKGIAEEARMIANNATVETTVIEDLKPRRVRVEPDGVYIAIGGFFVTEYGFFVPRLVNFTPTSGGDPSYTPLGEGVWRYDIAG
jgi:hypothetical protein